MARNRETRATTLSNEVAEAIWEQFHEQLAREATKQLFLRQITEDASDLVVSAMGSFFRRYDDFNIESDNALWGLLKQILKHKICALVDRVTAIKRGRATNESDVHADFSIEQVVRQRGLPNLVEECIDLLMDIEQISLFDSTDKQIVELLRQGYNYKQVAKQLGITTLRLKQRLTTLRQRFDTALSDTL